MTYYRGDYYRGDYYRGDFWSKLGKGIKKVGKGIGRAAKALAPVAGIILPAVGAATLVGRAYSASKRVQKVRDDVRSLVAQPPASASPTAIVTSMTGQMIGIPSVIPIENRPSTTTGARRTRTIRRAKRKRQARTAYRRRVTRKRRTRRARR